MFTTSPRTTLKKLLPDVLRSPDPVRQISMSSSSFEKSKFLFRNFLKMEDAVCHYENLDQRPLHKRALQSNLQKKIQDCGPIKSSKENTQRVVE